MCRSSKPPAAGLGANVTSEGVRYNAKKEHFCPSTSFLRAGQGSPMLRRTQGAFTAVSTVTSLLPRSWASADLACGPLALDPALRPENRIRRGQRLAAAP